MYIKTVGFSQILPICLILFYFLIKEVIKHWNILPTSVKRAIVVNSVVASDVLLLLRRQQEGPWTANNGIYSI